MTRRSLRQRRYGVAAAESAIVLPTLLFLIFAIVVGGLGVFRYQQIAMLAREGARYASVHGGLYEQETGNPAATQQDIQNNVIIPFASGLDPAQLNCTVIWQSDNMPYSFNNNDYVTPTNNIVEVTVYYNWIPELFLVGPIVLTSTSRMPISY